MFSLKRTNHWDLRRGRRILILESNIRGMRRRRSGILRRMSKGIGDMMYIRRARSCARRHRSPRSNGSGLLLLLSYYLLLGDLFLIQSSALFSFWPVSLLWAI